MSDSSPLHSLGAEPFANGSARRSQRSQHQANVAALIAPIGLPPPYEAPARLDVEMRLDMIEPEADALPHYSAQPGSTEISLQRAGRFIPGQPVVQLINPAPA